MHGAWRMEGGGSAEAFAMVYSGIVYTSYVGVS